MMQLFVNALVSGCATAIVALGFGIVYHTTRIFHFAHGAFVALGAYIAFSVAARTHLPLWFVGVLAPALTAICGVLISLAVYEPLRRKHASRLPFLLASLGALVAIQECIALVFGTGTRRIPGVVVDIGYSIFGARATGIQIAAVVITLVLFGALGVWQRWSRLGLEMRALADTPDLAVVVGVRIGVVVVVTFGLSAMLAGIAGFLLGCDADLTPWMGFRALLLGVVASIVGGLGSVRGALLGGLLVSGAQQAGVWWFPSHWQDGFIFLLFLAFLLLRPQGLIAVASPDSYKV